MLWDINLKVKIVEIHQQHSYVLVADETGSVEVIIDDQNTFRKLATGMTVFVRNSCVIMTENHFIQIKVNIWAHIEAFDDGSDFDEAYEPNISKQKVEDKRMFGFYFCEDCKKGWTSAYSWYEYGQECKKCFKLIDAYRRKELQHIHSDVKKPHLMNLCEKCKKLGRHCNEENFKRISKI